MENQKEKRCAVLAFSVPFGYHEGQWPHCCGKGARPMNLPKDPMMLLSVVNTKLRDEYPSPRELCRSLRIDESELCNSLAGIGYEYDGALNPFA